MELPSVLITSLEQDLLDSIPEIFPPQVTHHLISQYYLLQAAKEALCVYKKRMDFDYLQVMDRFERVVQEQADNERFMRLQTEIIQATEVLDGQAREEVRRMFMWKEKWSVLHY